MNRQVRRWSGLAERIPEEAIRVDALRALNSKRGHIAGAVAFTIIPGHRSPELLQALLTHQVIVDYLDTAHERHPTLAGGDGLHLAVRDALIPGGPLSDYYADHPWKDDADYLQALVEDCRHQCEALPSFASVQPLLVREADRARRILTLNHLPDPDERDSGLRQLAMAEFPGERRWSWFELTAGTCGQLAIFALLALAAKPELDEREVAATYDAYWPLMPLLATMLDSYVDRAEDVDDGNHQYVSHYPDPDQAVERISELIEMAAREVLTLPGGHRHAVILSCMVGLYLTKDSARTPAMASGAEQLVRAGGSLSRALMPVLRIWRSAYAQRGA
jgi:tetraprenyl-beta-curcumene synthase